jgi:hypothetical protein
MNGQLCAAADTSAVRTFDAELPESSAAGVGSSKLPDVKIELFPMDEPSILMIIIHCNLGV